MYIKVILGLFVVVSFSLLVTNNHAYADCEGFAIEDFDPGDYDAIFIGEPIFETNQKNQKAQLIEVQKVYSGFANTTEWVHFLDRGLDEEYCNYDGGPSALHTTELYMVHTVKLYGTDYTSQPFVAEKFEIGSKKYKEIVRAIEKYNQKNFHPELQTITAKEQKDEIEKKMQILIDEVTLLLKEYLQSTKEGETLKADVCEGNTDAQLLACLTIKNKAAELDVSLRLSTLKYTLATNETDLWKILVHAQEVWRMYRDAACDVESYYSRGGTAYNTYQTRCLMEKNQDRATYLQVMIENP